MVGTLIMVLLSHRWTLIKVVLIYSMYIQASTALRKESQKDLLKRLKEIGLWKKIEVKTKNIKTRPTN